jgi:hypothetical protein
VLRMMLGIHVVGSIPLFMVGVVIYLFFATAIGIFLGTVAAARFALHAGLFAHEHALRQQYTAREHAALACQNHAGVAIDPFRRVRAVYSLSRSRARRGVARIPCGRGRRSLVLCSSNPALPLGRNTGDVKDRPECQATYFWQKSRTSGFLRFLFVEPVLCGREV